MPNTMMVQEALAKCWQQIKDQAIDLRHLQEHTADTAGSDIEDALVKVQGALDDLDCDLDDAGLELDLSGLKEKAQHMADEFSAAREAFRLAIEEAYKAVGQIGDEIWKLDQVAKSK